MSEFEKDLADVMGSFISTELDYIEKSSNELEEVTKERDLYKSVIEEVREYIKDTCYNYDFKTYKEAPPYVISKLLQILDKAKENK